MDSSRPQRYGFNEEAVRVRRYRDTIIRLVEPDVMADCMNEAAEDILNYGWRRGGCSYPDEHNPQGTYARCIWVAGLRALERNIKSISVLSAYVAGFENALMSQLVVPTLLHTFEVNDKHLGSDAEGQAWAIANLLELATKLRGADARMLVAGPDTDTIVSPVFGCTAVV